MGSAQGGQGAAGLAYRPPGPVAEAFYETRAKVSMIMGPFGSGKTGASLMRMPLIAVQQRPSPVDNIRRTKFAVVRDTYRNLNRTTIPSWHSWIPKSLGHWTGGGNEPAVHTVNFSLPDGTIAEMIVQFIGLGENSIEATMRGWEGTGFYLNEADMLDRSVLTWLLGRLGRYPKKNPHGGPSWSGGWCDMNAPDDENWTVKFFFEKSVGDADLADSEIQFFRQPSGLSADAENLENLPDGYYQNLMIGQEDWWIRRNIRNEFGYSRDGKPVYGDDYSDQFHVAGEPIRPTPGLPIVIGADAGRTPSAILIQKQANGQRRILNEHCVEDAGARKFGKSLAEFLRDNYPGFDFIGWGDPAAAYKGDLDESTWLELLSQETGIAFTAAPCLNNSLTERLEAVRTPLSTMIDGEPGFLLSPVCKRLRKGFNSGYRYKRVRVAGEEKYEDKPEKNQFSHPHDALQYGLLGDGAYYEIRGRRDEYDRRRRSQTRAVVDDDEGGYARAGGWAGGQRDAIT